MVTLTEVSDAHACRSLSQSTLATRVAVGARVGDGGASVSHRGAVAVALSAAVDDTLGEASARASVEDAEDDGVLLGGEVEKPEDLRTKPISHLAVRFSFVNGHSHQRWRGEAILLQWPAGTWCC